jgi:sugar O-acyltransferase (sialic acid O-acetyltransferase NeuD family)
MRKLIICGAGGHAREVFQLVADINATTPRWQVVAFLVEEAFRKLDRLYDLPVIAGLEAFGNHLDAHAVIAIGSPETRRRMAEAIRAENKIEFATLIHPSAWVATRTQMGEGTQIFAGSIINTDVAIGAHVIVNAGGKISHDTIVGDYSSLGPNVTLCGRVRIGSGVDLGATATVIPNCTVGANCRVGAGAVVVTELAAGITAVGSPARPRV